MPERKEYSLSLQINNRQITRRHFPIDKEKDGFQYFVIEPVVYKKNLTDTT